ncbi:hypothetical protein Aperf_G00000105037 [Anoplocephala perfoliata]
MSPPTFADIGKSVRDILRKNFDLGMRFVSYKGSLDDFEYTSRIDNAFRYKKMYGSFQSSYFWKKYGIKLEENFNSKGFISAQASMENQIHDGLTNSVKANYDVHSKRTTVNMKSVYTSDHVKGELDFKLPHPLPDVAQSLVIAHQDYLVGIGMDYDSNRKELKFLDLAFAYSISDFGFHAIITNWARTFTAGVYQRITDRIEYVAEATWHRNDSAGAWAICCQYAVDEERKHILKLKLDNQQRISVCLINRVLEGVKTSVCALFNDIEETQIGFGVEIER